MLVSKGLKGSGDYGVFAFGAYNGQTANKPELNNKRHLVARITYPIQIGNQIIEPAIQAYTGDFVIPLDQTSKQVKITNHREYLDQRVAATFVLYPQPFGIMAEYNLGKGPEFNKFSDSIETQNLQGGFIMIYYQLKLKSYVLFPFIRGHYYNGGKKHELDARSYLVRELEIGAEWQPSKNFELVAMYTISSRTFEDYSLPNNAQVGNLLRLQAQINF